MDRRQLLQYFAGCAAAAGTLSAQAQDDFPSRPIRLIVSSSPGALLDAASRLYADRMSAYLRQPVVVENMAGGGGLLAVRHVSKSPADGHTLLAAANTITTVPYLNSKAGYSLKEFAGVGEMARSPSLLVVGAGSPFKSIADIVAAAKKTPGGVNYGSGGVGTTSHLPVELFAREVGITLTHVPYKGVAVVVPDVVANRVGFMMGTPTSLAELMKSGSLRALAITSAMRSLKFPDVPTFRELGLGEATFDIWVSLLAPAATPKAVRGRIAEAMEAARKDPNLVARLESQGQVISDVRTPDQADAVLRAEDARYRKLIRDAKIESS
jgi:tripartite-type tricarboxylate transporter receptor subunit TctC